MGYVSHWLDLNKQTHRVMYLKTILPRVSLMLKGDSSVLVSIFLCKNHRFELIQILVYKQIKQYITEDYILCIKKTTLISSSNQSPYSKINFVMLYLTSNFKIPVFCSLETSNYVLHCILRLFELKALLLSFVFILIREIRIK